MAGPYDGGIYSNKWAIVYETTFEVAASSLDINVDIASDFEYEISIISKTTAPAVPTIKLYLNGNTTDANYEGSLHKYDSGTLAWAVSAPTGPIIATVNDAGADFYSHVRLTQFDAASVARMYGKTITSNGVVTESQDTVYTFSNSLAKRITQLNLRSSTNLNAGTRIVIRRYS